MIERLFKLPVIDDVNNACSAFDGQQLNSSQVVGTGIYFLIWRTLQIEDWYDLRTKLSKPVLTLLNCEDKLYWFEISVISAQF